MYNVGDKVLLTEYVQSNYNISKDEAEGTISRHINNFIEVKLIKQTLGIQYDNIDALKNYFQPSIKDVNKELLSLIESMQLKFYCFEGITTDGKVIKLSL